MGSVTQSSSLPLVGPCIFGSQACNHPCKQVVGYFSSSWAWNCLHLDIRTPLRYSIEQRPSTKLCNIVVFGHGVESFTNLVLNLDLQLPKLIANYLIENFFMSSS
jgi:hypothetical protein